MRYLLGLLLCSLLSLVFAENININPAVTKVDLYLDFANIERRATIDLTTGTHELTKIVPNPTINESLKVTTDNADFVIKSSVITESLRTKEEIYNNEHYQTITRKISEINEQIKLSVAKDHKLNKEKMILETHRIKLLRVLRNPYKKMIITVEAKNEGKSNLTINYTTNAAGWMPGYLMKSPVHNQVIVFYRATLYQKTAENWDNIALSLYSGSKNKKEPNLLLKTVENFSFSALTHHTKLKLSKAITPYERTIQGGSFAVKLTNTSEIPYLKGPVIFAGKHQKKMANIKEDVPPNEYFSILILR